MKKYKKPHLALSFSYRILFNSCSISMAVRYKELNFTNKETEAQRVGKEVGLYPTSNQ